MSPIVWLLSWTLSLNMKSQFFAYRNRTPYKEVCAPEFVNTYQQLSAMHLPTSVKEANPFMTEFYLNPNSPSSIQ